MMSASTTCDSHSVSSSVSHNSSTASGAPPLVPQNPFEAVLPRVPFAAAAAAAAIPVVPQAASPLPHSSLQSPMKVSSATTMPSSIPPYTATPPIEMRSPAPPTTAPLPARLPNTATAADLDLLFDDDENTAPSSLGNDNDTQQSEPTNRFTTRFLESTKRFMNNPPRKDSDELLGRTTLIAGYLQKLGRNGKWQTRWFETNGEFLSYYKSSKRAKLLATLDLQKVGIIEIDSDDKTEHSFRIQVMGRLYHLRANSRASCHDWVITLNRVKEARMQQGNVKLVGRPTTTTAASLASSALDLLQNGKTTSQVEDGTPRVVVVSNRERTRAVDEADQWDQLIRVDPHHTTLEMDVDPVTGESMYAHNKRLSSIGTVVAARWTKHQSSLQRVGTKVSKWARSVKQYSCTTADGTTENPAHASLSGGGGGVQLDKYLHPPGHDDKRSKQKLVFTKPELVKDRALSSASDYDARTLS